MRLSTRRIEESSQGTEVFWFGFSSMPLGSFQCGSFLAIHWIKEATRRLDSQRNEMSVLGRYFITPSRSSGGSR
jgi:hypothetical protein